MSSIIIKASFKNVCGFITPNNILDIHPFKDFFIQTVVTHFWVPMKNKINSQKRLEKITFKTCQSIVRMQHARKNIFFLNNIFFFDEIGYFNTEFVSPQHKKYKLTLSHFKKYTGKNQKYF